MVTGGANGIGRGCALRLAEEGAALAVVDREADTLGALTAEVEALGGAIFTRAADCTSPDAARAFVTDAEQHFGKIDVPLGTVLRLRRGKVDLPLDGGPEILRAASTWDEAPDGRLVVNHGDSFVMFVTWLKGRVSSESIQPYGAASSRPASPHYNDQAKWFVAHRLKPVWFYSRDLKGNIERLYRP